MVRSKFILSFIAVFVINTSNVISANNKKLFLPWDAVVQQVNNQTEYCLNLTPTNSKSRNCLDLNGRYSFQPGDDIQMKLSQELGNGNFPAQCQVKISRFQNRSIWKQIGSYNVVIKPNQTIVTPAIQDNGFYWLEVSPLGFEIFIVISDNWKRELFRYCQAKRMAIETQPDQELIRSSIAVSHFNHTMKLASDSTYLSGKILLALTQAVNAKLKFDSEAYPDFVIGSVNKVRLRRFQGAPIAEFAVYIPPDYDPTRKWPIYLRPDSPRWSVGKYGGTGRHGECFHDGMIDLWWYTVDYFEPEWADYQILRDLLITKLNIDTERQYLYGFCDNAWAAISLALKYPDCWAELNFDTGGIVYDLAGNAANMKVNMAYGSHQQDDDFSGRQDFVSQLFRYYGCANVKDKETDNISSVLPTTRINRSPQKVMYSTNSLSRGKAYWISIDGRIDENVMGTMDVKVQEQRVYVKTENVDAYTLDLSNAPVSMNSPVEIIENGQKLCITQKEIFTKRSEKYNDAEYIKNKRLHGPIKNVFNDPFLIVWGTHTEDKAYLKQCEKLAQSLGRTTPKCADYAYSEEMIRNHNLVLIGTPETNTLYSTINARLPVHMQNGIIKANGATYENDDFGFFFIYPNPLNPEKYIAIFSASSLVPLEKMYSAYEQMKGRTDICIFEVSDKKEIIYHVFERFNTIWKWHKHWDDVVVVLREKHPNWQWRQWILKSARNHFNADVIVCDDPIEFPYLTPNSDVSYRDLFNYLNNYWLVKITVKGQVLKDLLTVAFESTLSNRNQERKDILIVDGIKYQESLLDTNTIKFGDVKADKDYTAVISSKVINRLTAGIKFVDYDIVNDGDMLLVIQKYLIDNEDFDLDKELNNVRLGII